MSSAATSTSSSDSEQRPTTTKRKLQDDSDSDDSSSSSRAGEDDEDVDAHEDIPGADPSADDVPPVLSHKDQRRQKKKAKLMDNESSKDFKSKSQPSNSTDASKAALHKRQNSVWVGNLSFKTTSESLKKFFEEAGEVTRVHMPTKLASGPGGNGWKGARTENRGFAYVDFSKPGEKLNAIALSERNLDGRRLLIKDGDDFANRPTPALPSTAANPGTGHSKTALKILAAQKRAPAPTLFVGNLGFEATEEGIRGMVEAHGRAAAVFGRGGEKGKGKKKDGELERDAEVEGDEEGDKERVDLGIRKVRVGQFEDSGLCKGFAFIDFATTEQATAALTNPKNHHLDGRKLVLEYASPDAVKRSGLHRDGESESRLGAVVARKGGELGTGTGGGKRRPDKQTRISMREAAGGSKPSPAQAEQNTNMGEDASGAEPPSDQYERRAKRPSSGKPYTNPRHRAKPGAALAQAQREKVAIVPSQGTRIVFS